MKHSPFLSLSRLSDRCSVGHRRKKLRKSKVQHSPSSSSDSELDDVVQDFLANAEGFADEGNDVLLEEIAKAKLFEQVFAASILIPQKMRAKPCRMP